MQRTRFTHLLAYFSYVFIAVLAFGTTAAADEKPILTINPGGHTAMVRELIFTPDGRELISAGNDKVIRVWDVETGELNRTLRGQIGAERELAAEFEGMIYAAALSPDGRTLAVGGFTGKSGSGDHPIRLFDLATGDVIDVLKGHTNVISDLAFSPDGRYLASGSGDETVRLWKPPLAKNAKSEHVLKGHTDSIYGVAFTADGKSVVSASDDHTLRLWNVSNGSLIRKMTGHSAEVRCVATSPDGKWIASGSVDHTIRLWRADPSEFVEILGKHNDEVATVSFSPDGRRLVSVEYSRSNKARVWSVPDGKILTTFDKHNNSVIALAWHPAGDLVATAGGNNNDIYIWDADTGKVVHHIVGTGRSVWSVAFSKDGRRIAFGNVGISRSNWNKGKLERTFDLIDMTLDADVTYKLKKKDELPKEFVDAVNSVGLGKYLNSEEGIRKLKTFFESDEEFTSFEELTSLLVSADLDWIRADTERAGLTLNLKDKTTLEIKRGSRTKATIKLNQSYDRVRCYTFTRSGKIVVGSGFTLALYDTDGNRIHKFVGHTGEVWAVAVSPDGRYLASASGDQTVRLWNIETGELLTSIFVGSNREWVAWTPAGYYKASAGGGSLIGWHINQGEDRPAKYYLAYQFSDQFNRPDVLSEILRAGSVEKAVQRADKKRGRLTETVRIEQVIKSEPPTITIIEPSDHAKTSDKEIRIRVKIVSEEKITQIIVSINGVPVSRKKGFRIKQQENTVWVDEKVRLDEGKNVLSVVAHNKSAKSQPAKVRVTYKPIKIDLTKPNLYVLAIGVSDYQNDLYDLGFCDDDAQAFAEFFEGQQGKLYGRVQIKILTDDRATEDSVLEAFEWLISQATHKDLVMLFVAGHGVKDARGNYYFFPYNGNRERLRSTAIAWTEFTRTMAELPCKRMLFMDTCHAGGVTGSPLIADASRRRRALDATEAVRELSSDEIGCVVMASSMGREPSNENEQWRHGAFTRALLEGFGELKPFGSTSLPENADCIKADGVVYLNELDAYVAERVKELTDGAQHPNTQKPSTVRSFPIAVIR